MQRRNLLTGLMGILLVGCSKIGLPLLPVKVGKGSGTEQDPYEDLLAHGKSDQVYSRMLYARLQIAEQIKSAFPNFGTCYRCDFPWAIVRSHSTQYDVSWGCFPLCEDCWTELQAPEYRMPYYRELIEDWKKDGATDAETKWPLIEAAVRKGL